MHSDLALIVNRGISLIARYLKPFFKGIGSLDDKTAQKNFRIGACSTCRKAAKRRWGKFVGCVALVFHLWATGAQCAYTCSEKVRIVAKTRRKKEHTKHV